MPDAPGTPAAAPAAPAPAAPPAPEPPKKKDVSPRLPGVVPDDFGSDDQPPRRKIAPIRDDRPAIDRVAGPAETPARDQHGRFLPQGSESAAPVDPAAIVDDAVPADPAEPVEPVEKFKFAGMEFDSREAAEQYFRSERGQQKRAQALKADRDTAASRANEWKAEADRRAQRIAALEAQLKGGRPAAPTSPHPVTAPTPSTQPASEAEVQKAFEETVDWDLYKELYTTKGPEYAQYWYAREQTKFFTEFLKSQLDEIRKPQEQQQQQMQVLHAAHDLFTRVQAFEDPETGEPFYPELSDPQAQPVIAKIYVDLGHDPSGPRPELGVHYAVLSYRDWMTRQARGQARPQTPSPTPPAAPAASVLDVMNAGRAAQSTVLSGTGTPRPATADQAPELQIKKAIREASTVMPGLGFAP